jgi:PEP-CTERM motif
MRRMILWVPLCASFLAANINAGTIDQQTSNATSSSLEYTFDVSGFNFLGGEALDIQFDPAVYLALLDATAPAGYTVVTLDPNNPPGAPGDFIVEGLMGTQSLTGSNALAVTLTLSGNGAPGPLPYFVYSLDDSGNFGDVVGSGTTTMVNLALATPEPYSLSLAGLGILAAGFLRTVKRWR